MARAIEDAVYLDEDAYNQMIPMQQYTRTIEAGHHIMLSCSVACQLVFEVIHRVWGIATICSCTPKLLL